jgi:hypothetical protein
MAPRALGLNAAVWGPKILLVGVCILRVEPQEEYLLITVTANRHLAHSLAFAEPEQVSTYTNRADAFSGFARVSARDHGWRVPAPSWQPPE